MSEYAELGDLCAAPCGFARSASSLRFAAAFTHSTGRILLLFPQLFFEMWVSHPMIINSNNTKKSYISFCSK